MDADAIRRRLKDLRVSPLNLQMVEYWLSLSANGALPCRDAFDPSDASDLLRGCGLFEVRPGESVTCRIADVALKMTCGPNIAGTDWLAMTPPRYRAQRLARYSAVAEGAIGLVREPLPLRAPPPSDLWGTPARRRPVQIEEILLPFCCNEDGLYPVLYHTDWRPTGTEWFGVDPSYATTPADDFRLVEID